MWGPFCSCPAPCAAICYRRCIPCRSPCCSYAAATPPPSSIPVDTTIFKKKCKKSKKKGKKLSANKLLGMTTSKLALLSKSDLENMTASQIALLSPSKQELIRKMMAEAGIPLDKFAGAGNVEYAGSEGGFVTRRCDPRCKSRRSRPSTAGCTPRQPMNDPSKYSTATYCGVGGIYKSDACTATDIKNNAATSTNNLELFCSAQKPETNKCSEMCGNLQYTQAMQQQYNQALQQQWLQKCYYCQVMAQQNPFRPNNYSPLCMPANQNYVAPNVQQVYPTVPQSQNSFQQGSVPCSPIFSGLFSFPSNQSQNCQSFTMSWPGIGSSVNSPSIPNNVASMCKKCETCGRVSIKK